MGSIVAQASEENNATALLMVGMYDITKKSNNTGKMFDPSNPITGFQSKEKQRLAGWHAIIKSGELGNPVAAMIGGSALLFGDLDPDMKDHYPQPDKALGIKLLDSAHNKGVGKASQYLAIAYHVGLSGVEKNQSKAKEYVLGMIKNTLYS